MIGYVTVQEQVQNDFHRARRKASLRRWRNRLRNRDCAHERLLSFEEAKGDLAQWTQAYRGMRVVEVEKIRGSVGRYRDFDSSFLPLKVNMAERWGRIDRAYHTGDELPAVSLYKIGEGYFVRDGNHRVSVAKYHKVAAIDAEVVELRGHTPTDTAQRTTRLVGTPTHRPLQPPAEPGASWLHKLRQHLRPGSLRPGARPAKNFVVGVAVILTLTLGLASTALVG
jgi:hypothetical protein